MSLLLIKVIVVLDSPPVSLSNSPCTVMSDALVHSIVKSVSLSSFQVTSYESDTRNIHKEYNSPGSVSSRQKQEGGVTGEELTLI